MEMQSPFDGEVEIKSNVTHFELPGRIVTPEEYWQLFGVPTPEEIAEFEAEMAAIDEAERRAWEESHTVFLR